MTMATNGQKIRATYKSEDNMTTVEGKVCYVSEGYYVLYGGAQVPAVPRRSWNIEIIREPIPRKPGTVVKSRNLYFMRAEAGDFIDVCGGWWSEDDVQDCEVVYVPE